MARPSTWEEARVDRVATVKARIGWKALTASEYQDEGYIFLSTPNIKGRRIDFDAVNYISERRYLESPELMLQEGDVLLAKDGSTLGITAIVERLPAPATVNSSIAVIRPFAIDSRFLRYVLASDMTQALIGELKDGMGVPHLFQWDINRLPVPLPPLEEQRRIADFLDDQTTRIDQIIEARQQQIDMLDDLHLRLIYEATSGERDSLAMWGTWKVSVAFETGSGTTPASDKTQYFDGRIPWVNSGDLNDSRVQRTSKTVTDEALRDYSALKVHPAGSLMVAMYGATVGRTGVLSVDACVNQAVCVLRERGPLTTAFAHYWFLGQRANIVLLASGGGQPNISQEVIRAQRIAAPTIREQTEIVNELDIATVRRNETTTGLKASIDLLQEFKRSLISAAVSGEFEMSAASGRGVPA